MERLLTVDEIANMLQVTKSTIYSMVHHGKIPYVKLSRKILRFKDSDIQEWLKSCDSSNQSSAVKLKKVNKKKKAGHSSVDEIFSNAMKEVLSH